MKTLTLTLVACLSCAFARSQMTFEKVYGGSGDRANSIVQTSDGGYILAGSTSNFASGGTDVHIVKTGVNGDTAWTRSFGSASIYSDYANCIRQTSDGGYIVAGRTDDLGPGGQDAYLLKLNSTGDTSWTHAYGSLNNDWANAVEQTQDGGYIIAGGYQTGVGYFIIKTDANGDTTWTREYGTQSNDVAVSVIEDGSAFMVGGSKWNGTGFVFNISKLNSGGDEIFSRSYTCSVGATCNLTSMIKTSDGNFLLAGYENGYGNGSSIYLVKVTPAGDTIWTRTYAANGFEYAYDVKNTLDGGYIITGSTQSAGIDKALLMKITSGGNISWQKSFGGSSYAYGYSVVQAVDSGFVLAGNIYESSGSPRGMYLIKTDPLGNSCSSTSTSLTISYPPTTEVLLTTYRYTGVGYMRTSSLVRRGSAVTVVCFSNAIADENNSQDIKVYPNPSGGNLILDLGTTGGNALITLYDQCGRVIRNYSIVSAQQLIIERGDLVAGNYFIEVSFPEQDRFIRITLVDI